jgi:uncharacterized membrane protein
VEWLVIIGLIVALALLWSRVRTLEVQVRELEAAEHRFAYGPAHEPTPPDEAIVRTMPAAMAEPELAAGAIPPPIPELPNLIPSWEPVAPEAETPPAEPGFLGRRPSFDFEDVFGRRLPIWAGGIALAVAGVFLVRFSIEAGLLTPQVRVALSFLFGLALLAGAEAACRFEDRVRDPRIRQALAGAGLATLYAAFYLAGTQYGLIGTGAAFLGLAVVTAAAIALSFRFGLPSAVLGLVGGFAAPALVASEEGNVPLLTLYLALITAGLAFTGARQGRPWLGYAALGGGFLWGLALLASGPVETADLLALGLFLAAMGAALPLLAGGGAAWHWARLGAAGLASLQLAALIEFAGFDALTWGLYLLLAAALAALGWREPRLREASAFGAALGLWLLTLWDAPPANAFALVGAGFAAVFVLAPLAFLLLGRGRKLDLRQLSLAAPALAAVTYGRFGAWDSAGPEPLLAAVTAALALPPAVAAWREWKLDHQAAPIVLPIASAAALVFAALLMLVPAWAAPLAAASVALVLARLAFHRPQAALLTLAWTGSLVALAALAATPYAGAEGVLLAGIDDPQRWFGGPADPWFAPLRWLATGLPFVALALIEPRRAARYAAEGISAGAAYGVLAQILPADWLAWTAALGAIVLCLAFFERRGGWATLLLVTGLWFLEPFGEWAGHGAAAIGGFALLLQDVPGWRDILLQVLPLAAAAGVVAWRNRSHRRIAAIVPAIGAVAALVALHSLYKHVFAIGTAEAFVRLGLAERTVWQALLAGAGLFALERARESWKRPAAVTLLALSLAHFVWFTLAAHDPLWNAQAVGRWPVVNALLPAYAVACLAVVALRRLLAGLAAWIGWTADAALMALIALFALSQLRQAFSGSLLTAAPMTPSEDLLRSLLGIVLAIAFLAWGSRTQTRSWRVGSLVLMLLAVGKVFLVDAAGLAGLLRVASFMALGFSLIGIGWVYSRQLAVRKPADTVAPAGV